MYKTREVNFVAINSRVYSMCKVSGDFSPLAVFARLSFRYSHKVIKSKAAKVNYLQIARSIQISETTLRIAIKWLKSRNLITIEGNTLKIASNKDINAMMGNTKEIRVYDLGSHRGSKLNLISISMLSYGYRCNKQMESAIHLSTEKNARKVKLSNSRGEKLKPFTVNLSNSKCCELLGFKSNSTSQKYKKYINEKTKREVYRRYEYLCNVTSMREYFSMKEDGSIPNNAKCVSGIVFKDLPNGFHKKGEKRTDTFNEVVLNRLEKPKTEKIEEITTLYYVR